MKFIFKQFYSLFNFYYRNNRKDPEGIEINLILKELREKGYYIIENYYSKTKCEELELEIDRLISNYSHNLKIEESSNDFRLNGADRISEEIKNFKNDKFLNAICNLFLEKPAEAFFVLAAKIESKENKLGSGGNWHRDINFPNQFKAMMYLTDVDEKNGPFEYITGTNKWFSLIDGIINFGTKDNQNRLNSIVVNKFIQNYKYNKVTFHAKNGTLILFNSFGIHRGAPLESSHRYAITNYYYPTDHIKSNFDRLVKKFKIPTN